MFRIVTAIIGLEIIDAADVPPLIENIKKPGAAIDFFTRFWMNPDHVQPVIVSQFERINPFEKVATTSFLPALQIGIADAAPISIDQIQTAMPA